MKLLLDECIPWKVKSLFTTAGHGEKAKTHPCTSKGAAPTRLFAEK
jgi:hypothetical protein